MYVRLRGDEVLDVKLRIYEPPRFFEAFLRGRSFMEVTDITARICGICPVAYQTSAAQALEDACGATVDGQLRALRRLIYCGEWIESHGLHVYMLHAPDFMGYESAMEMARDHPEIVERGLRLKKAGNALIALVGGREVHPSTFGLAASTACRPRPSCSGSLTRSSAPARTRSKRCAGRRGSIFPTSSSSTRWWPCAPKRTSTRSMTAGSSPTAGSTSPLPIRRHLRRGAGPPLERPALPDPGARRLPRRVPWRDSRSTSTVSRRWRAMPPSDAGLDGSCRNPFQSIVVRSVEILYAFDEALRLIARIRAAGPGGGRARAATGDRLRGERGSARPPLSPLRDRR